MMRQNTPQCSVCSPPLNAMMYEEGARGREEKYTAITSDNNYYIIIL